MPRHLLGHLLGDLLGDLLGHPRDRRPGGRPGRVRATVTALALAAPLAGCGAGAAGSGDEALEIWIRQAPGSDADRTAQKLAAAFTAASGVPARVVALLDDFETKLQQQAARRNLPDIVINDTAQLGTMRTQGWIREVDRAALTGGGAVADLAWKAAQASDGGYYGVPFSSQSFALLIRKDWRERAGLPVPRSWADLAKLARAFTEDDPDGDGADDTAGLVVPAGTKRGYASWYASSLIYANGGDFLTDRGGGRYAPAVAAPAAVEAVTWLRDQFCTAKTVNPGAVSNDTTVTHEVFEKGQGGIYLTGPYVLARFEKNIGPGRIEVVPVPKGPSGGPGTLGEGENVYLMAGSDREAEQRRFAEFAISPEGQKIGMNGDAPGAIVRLPVNTSVDMAAVREDPGWQVFQDAYKDARYNPPVPNWTPFRQAAADAFNALWADCSADAAAAMDRLAATFAQELKNQNAAA